MEEVDLKNFQVIKNKKGVVFIDKTNVMLQNAATGEVLTTSFDNVSSFYGLDSLSSDTQISPGEEDNYQEYFPETSLREVAGDSSDDAPLPEDIPNIMSRPPIKWGQEETKFMLKLYTSLINCVGPYKKFRTKKLMWTHIATLIQHKFKISPNATQVETRYKCVSKRTKKPNLMIPINKAVREEVVYNNEIFAKCEQDDPIGIETVMSQGRIFMLPQKPVMTVPPPAPSTLLKMIPAPPEEEDDEEVLEGDTTQNSTRRSRKPPQVIMFEKYLQQKAEFYEKREAKTDQRAKKKAEREKEKERFKQQREKAKIEREKQKELMKQQRHLEKMKLLRDLLNKSCSK